MRLKDWIQWKQLTYRQAADLFRCSEIRVRQMCAEKNPVRPGSSLALRIRDATTSAVTLDELLQPNRNVSESDAAA